jgi:hypothetical protein
MGYVKRDSFIKEAVVVRWSMVMFLLGGCVDTNSDPVLEDTGETKGACGEVTEWDITVYGVVTLDGDLVEGASIELEDRGYNLGTILGSGISDANGEFEFLAAQVVSVEDCWGTLLNYYLNAESGDLFGEKKVNTYLHTAIYDETLEADIRGFPVKLE